MCNNSVLAHTKLSKMKYEPNILFIFSIHQKQLTKLSVERKEYVAVQGKLYTTGKISHTTSLNAQTRQNPCCLD